jgi:large subunit ribosomal protein L6
MAKQNLKDEINIAEGVEVTIEPTAIKVKGPNGELERRFYSPAIKISKKENTIIFEVKNAAKREKMMMKTTEAHIKNMIKGVTEGFEYTLKVCSGHFPMTVALEGREVIVKNFLGESIPRKSKIPEGADVQINGNDITVKSINKETAGQAAAKIEAITRMTNKDRRRFQDGIFITEKAGKKI